MELVQIVPTLQLDDGVGGYARLLGDALSRQYGIQSRFLVGDPAWSGSEEGLNAAKLPARTPAALLAALGKATVLVHYVNYAYQRRGCPHWLVEGLAQWRRVVPGQRLVTVFHEVYATGFPWQSAFWLLPVQRRLARRLLGLSDAAVTSLDLYVRRLGGARIAGKGEMILSPIFSNMGEPAAPPPLAARARRLVVFGGRGTRRRVWSARLTGLAAACRALGIEAICDVGPPVDLPEAVAGVPVERCGILPAAEVSALLAGSRAGLLAYPPDFLAKSGIFAAYSAHGLVPVCVWSPPLPARETGMARLYWHPGTTEDPEMIAAAARTWYEGHSLSRQVEMFHRLVSP